MTDQEEVLLTQEGLEELQKELQTLLDKRPQIIKKIDEARSLGDLSENEAYRAARQEQSFLEGRVVELEDLLKRARLAPKTSGSQIGIGSKVTIKTKSEEHEFVLVDEHEADPSVGKLSHTSPIGSALLGRRTGDRVEVETPIGKMIYTVLAIN